MEKGMGTLIPVGDLDALTEAMRDLLSDEEKRNSYSREAQNRMQAYRWDIVWQQWRDFIFSKKK
jgi:glycosyltransferase involved in cell wall biosynthesis